MNPAIILILLIAAVVGWFLSAGIYKTVGEHIKDVVDTAVDEMADDENDIEVVQKRSSRYQLYGIIVH